MISIGCLATGFVGAMSLYLVSPPEANLLRRLVSHESADLDRNGPRFAAELAKAADYQSRELERLRRIITLSSTASMAMGWAGIICFVVSRKKE